MIGRREVVIVWCMGLDHINTLENDNFYLLDSFQVISSVYVIFKRKKKFYGSLPWRELAWTEKTTAKYDNDNRASHCDYWGQNWRGKLRRYLEVQKCWQWEVICSEGNSPGRPKNKIIVWKRSKMAEKTEKYRRCGLCGCNCLKDDEARRNLNWCHFNVVLWD